MRILVVVSSALALLLWGACHKGAEAGTGAVRSVEVAYGDDSRKELRDLPPTSPYRGLARATVALVERRALTRSGDRWKGDFPTFKQRFSLCDTEAFLDQPVVGFCSGVLVRPNVVATSGHCLEDVGGEPGRIAFVFGVVADAVSAGPSEFPAADVYHGKTVLGSSPRAQQDWALIELDRPVTGRQPARLRATGRAQAGEAVVALGHPSGLPLKVIDGATILGEPEPGKFAADLDTYEGSSGSPVYGPTNEVEGLLSKGEVDFLFHKGCRVSRQCNESSCSGERVTRTENFLPLVPPA